MRFVVCVYVNEFGQFKVSQFTNWGPTGAPEG